MVEISIVIPVYNSGSTIVETLDSVLNQTFHNWEAICIDDGSSDNSVEIIKSYCQKDSRFRLIVRSSVEKGGSVCRNLGGFASTGRYIIFLDSDDLLAPWCLEQRYNTISSSTHDVVVFPIAYFTKNVSEHSGTRNLYSKNHLCRFISGSPTWQTMQPIYTAEVFNRLGGFDIHFPRFQDVEFGIRVLLNYKIKIIKNVAPDCYFRMSGNSGVINPTKAKNAIRATSLLLSLVNTNWNIIKEKKKSIAILGLLVNVITLEIIANIPVNCFFDNIDGHVDLKKLLKPSHLLLINCIIKISPIIQCRFLLKALSKIIDMRLDRG